MSRASEYGLRPRRLPRGTRRGVLAALLFFLLPAYTASAGMLEDRLAHTRAEGREVKQELQVVDKRQQVLVDQISALNTKLATMDRPIGRLTVEVDQLDYRIERRRLRIVELKADYRRQLKVIARLNRELALAREALAERVVAAYKAGDAGMLEHLAGAGNLKDLFEREEALSQVVGLDEHVIDRIGDTERAVRVKRARNHVVQQEIRDDIAQLARDREAADRNRAELQAKRDAVAGVRSLRDSKLRQLNSREHELNQRMDSLDEDAKVLKEVIATGRSTYGGSIGSVSPSGLIWPVNGPVVSPFGWRWGRPHEGIDIAVGTGTPIHAAASGVVTYAGWMSGYGNMVIIQHAGSLSTGYGHQSQIATSVGQLVTQGQVIGFVGCTGHCFGPHLHFETRTNGTATDPMKYL